MSEETALAPVDGAAGLDLTEYEGRGCNILSPTLRMDTAAPYLRLRAVEVRLDPDHERGDCYAAPGSRWTMDTRTKRRMPEMLAPAKTGLLKIASAAGLVLDPQNSRRINPAACERCLEMAKVTGQALRCGDCPAQYDTAYQHIGAVRTESGWQVLKTSYEWCLDAQRRKITAEAHKRASNAEKKGQSFDVDAHVERRLNEVTAERFGLAETKSLLRLIRAICHVRHSYPREYMARPFVVVRSELAPDYSDPAMRKALAQKALASGAELFGAGSERSPLATVREIRAESHVVEKLASEPDFSDEGKAEELPAEPDDEQPEEQDEPSSDNDDDSGQPDDANPFADEAPDGGDEPEEPEIDEKRATAEQLSEYAQRHGIAETVREHIIQGAGEAALKQGTQKRRSFIFREMRAWVERQGEAKRGKAK